MPGERTEAPTSRRRDEARQKGQVARSSELTSVFVLFAGVAALQFIGTDMLTRFSQVAREMFLKIGARDAQPNELLAMTASMLSFGFGAVAPLILVAAVVGVAATVVQSGPVLSLKPLAPDFNRVSPLNGFQRLFSGRSFVELAKALVKLGVTGLVGYMVITEQFSTLVSLQTASAQGAMQIVGGLMVELAQKCGLVLLVMAVADYVYQRHSLESSLKMSRQDIKDEFRSSEGDPQLKSKLRQMARQMASRRMMHSVPNADVVVTNPTHFAVALEYKPSRMGAPIVTAKGQNLIAEQIKRVAKEHHIPIVENPPLARALFGSVEIGDAIPSSLYQAVAEVLAFIYRLRDEAVRQSRSAGAAARPS
jgi:flagellar biosynthesis protein FlhB